MSIRTFERWVKSDGLIDKRKTAFRPSPKNKLTAEEREMILETVNSKKYCDLPPCKIIPLLANDGIYIASESSFYRVLRENSQLAHRQTSRAPRHNKPRECIAHGINQVWSWDISYLPTQIKGLYYYLYLVTDVYSRKIIGWSIHDAESSTHASCLIQQCCLDEDVKQEQLILHSDNGAPMKGLSMIAMLEQLGIMPSYSRPSVSDDNPFSESLFKTIKYHRDFPRIKRFASILEAREWMEQFMHWYNNTHLHSALKFITPAQRHDGEDQEIMRKRDETYMQAKQRHPERWTGATRNWQLPEVVTLNPDKKKSGAGKDHNNKSAAA